MPARRLLVPLAVPLAGLLAAAGCAGSGPEKVNPPTTRAGASSGPPPAGSGPNPAKEGWFGTADGLHARVEIKAVERQPARTVLRYAVTSLDDAAKAVPFAVSLLDPVGRRLYRPAPAASSSGTLAPGATRELTAEFPALPPAVQRLTVITAGTAGEFTGVPVTTGPGGGSGSATPGPSGSAPVPASPSGSASVPPSASASPSAVPAGAPGGAPGGAGPADLYDITEGETRDVVSGVADVTVNLRADVLFESGKAELSGRAKGVLDQTAAELRERAEPARGPLTIDGHTDSDGADDANLKLSRERAEAVAKELRDRLGGTFTYTAQGKGEAELIAKEGGADDARARSRNRRVKISYAVRQQAQGATPSPGTSPSTSPSASTSASTSPGASVPPGGTVRPADFRAQDGATVGSRTARFGGAKRRLDVKPFYRDGAYLVAVFEVVNEGPGTTPPDAIYPHKDYLGGVFTSFSVSVPGATEVYRAVRVGPPAANSATYVDPGRAVFRTGLREPVRGFVYLPAPPGNPGKVTFDAGPFGKVENVPVS
ncbi:OmpA family protein [Actinomadura viridis]|uniref:OmpA family protein n=1 Tax=Actinomadura viridis TaxID=58110 RepID=UPI0036B6F9BF